MSTEASNFDFGDVRTRNAVTDGEIIHGDSLTELDELPENHFHAVVTDPPYAINFMGEDWDNFRRKHNENDVERDDVGGRLSRVAPASGAEGDNEKFQHWCQMWAEKCIRVLKPGGHLLAFGGNRTHHRLMCGIEDAGFEIRDTITWHYGEGFPKGASLSTWLDGEDAEQWGEWRGQLKPATEFPVLARAPFDGSATQNQVEHGVGNLNVEACRIGVGSGGERDGEESAERRYNEDGSTDFAAKPGPRGGDENGRYPANLILDPVMAEVMDLQSGELKSGDIDPNYRTSNSNLYGGFDGTVGDVYADTGGASRFFYCSKAAKSERTHGGEVDNDHPTVKPIDLMEWLVKVVTAEDQWVLDPFCGSGTTLLAAQNVGRRVVGIEREESYIEIAEQRLEEVGQ